MPPRSYSSGTRSGGQSTASRSLSVNSNTPVSQATDARPPPIPAAFQRTPIDPSKVVCLGPLPENVRLSGHTVGTGSRIVNSDGRDIPASMFIPGSRTSEGSLGSNFTEEEVRMAEEKPRCTNHSSMRLSHGHHGTLPSQWETDRQSLPSQPREHGSETGSPKPVHSDESSEEGRIDPGRDLIHVLKWPINDTAGKNIDHDNAPINDLRLTKSHFTNSILYFDGIHILSDLLYRILLIFFFFESNNSEGVLVIVKFISTNMRRGAIWNRSY